MATTSDVAESTDVDATSGGVEGNSRITGAVGAVIFFLLVVEGITVLRVSELLTLHVAVGMMLVAFVAVKLGSTGYRFLRYYGGDAQYVDKGPPPIVLRVLGPVVALTTAGLLATGIGALLVGRDVNWLGRAHKAFFILWFGAMTVHVLGHALETPALAVADLRPGVRTRAPGVGARLLLLGVVAVVAVALGMLGIRWAHEPHGKPVYRPTVDRAVTATRVATPTGE